MKHKHIATVALMLNLGIAASTAQQWPVKMTFSGSMVPTSINLKPNTITDEELLAGYGTLGNFTFRKLRTDETSPQSSGSCDGGFGPNLRVVAGGGVFRFEGGSLLTVKVTEGSYCIDVQAQPPVGHLTETYQITGGTGRFKGASGTLTLTATAHPVLFSDSNAAVLLTSTGQFTGTISSAATEEESQGERQ
jgi:hypothetical protein